MGLVQRVLEASGIPTVALSMIPDLTRAVGVPRLAGISYPMGRPLGNAARRRRPARRAARDAGAARERDRARQLRRAALRVAGIAGPGPQRLQGLPPPPIVELLTKKPWLVARLYSGRIPRTDNSAPSTSTHALP